MIARWVALILLLAVGQSTPVNAGPAQTEPLLAPDTIWTYRYTLIDESGVSHVGMQRRLFGRTTFRGHDLYFLEDTNTVTPGAMQRVYLLWNRGHFYQVALELHESPNRVVEVLFDKRIPLDVPATLSGDALVIANGNTVGETPWSIALSIPGTETVTVPAGTFQAARMEQRFRLGDLKVTQMDHSVGLVSVRGEGTQGTDSGTVRVIIELISGPVPRG